jgi:twitching motility protein PilI
VPAVSQVPMTRRWFMGVANIRGNLYSVIDFASYLGLEAGTGRPGRLVLFGPRAGDFRAGLVVQKVVGLRNLAELAPAAAPEQAREWFGQRWLDADGSIWQEIDLARLARDAEFLQAGL